MKVYRIEDSFVGKQYSGEYCFFVLLKIIIKRSESDKNNIHFEAESTKKWYKSTNTISKKAYKILNCNKSFIRKLQGGRR